MFKSGDSKIHINGKYVGKTNDVRIHKPELHVFHRYMIRSDMNEVWRIENECFEFPWTMEDFTRCLRQRNVIGMVTEYDGEVVGYMIYEFHDNRFHLLNIAVARDLQWRGIGRQMIEKLKNRVEVQGRKRILCEVRETNTAAQFFFKSCGFRSIRILKDYYEDSEDDAYLFQFRHPLTPPNRNVHSH